jgi:ABC-type nitrate/sulfonate/bicarbonate transport system ATPase subunit
MRTTEKASLTVETLYQARALGFIYPAKEGDAVTALTAIDFDIRKGEFLSIVGPSGCGKTSLMKLLTGLQHPTAGRLTFRGQCFDKPPPGIGMAFQDSLLLPWRSVLDNILLPIEILHRPRAAYLDKAHELLATVGLTGAESRNIWELSGGMRQRVSLCRALIADPEVLLLDEPFAALDALTRIRMHELVRELVANHQPGVLLVTHDVDEAIALADRILVMRDGAIAFEHRAGRGSSASISRAELLSELGVVSHSPS